MWIARRAAVQGVFSGGDCELRVCHGGLEQRLGVDKYFGHGGNLVALNDMVYSHVVFVLFWSCTVSCALQTPVEKVYKRPLEVYNDTLRLGCSSCVLATIA